LQRTTGIRKLLSNHRAYTFFRRLTGSDHLNSVMINEYICPKAGGSLLDVGCGPADILRLLPSGTKYYGIDLSEAYIAAAKAQYGHRGAFLRRGTDDIDPEQFPRFDQAISLGVLHHLNDDQVIALLSKVRRLLRHGGTFVTYDPCFTSPQNPIARLIHKLDRGMHVRYDGEMLKLVRRVFPDCRHWIRTDLTTVPSTVIILKAQN
jgi:SAM-dependent methyltransferase